MMRILILSTLMITIVNCAKNEEAMESSEYSERKEVAILAGGCFWCIEAAFENLDGILSVISGYTGGKEKNPVYADVSAGKTGHVEAVEVTFNPEVISFTEILDIYWKQFDPTDTGGSFSDRGSQYKSAIFYRSKRQQEIAENSRELLEESGIFANSIATEIREYDAFYPAEEYHQNYFKKYPIDYNTYRKASGRDEFIAMIWDVPSALKYPKIPEDQLKEKLTALQYTVTKKSGTEPAFKNEYWDNKESGIYVCLISGAPLFSSSDMYDSGTGWPSFTKPIDARMLKKPIDNSVGISRIEVRSRYGDAHLGHVFNDGPEPTNLRYCMNSAALRFVPKSKMVEEGYEKHKWLVAEDKKLSVH